MNSLGKMIRALRDEKELPLQTVAAYLDIDQEILNEIEKGQCNANREQVVKLAEFFQIKESNLLTSWLSDKPDYPLADEELALKNLKVMEEKIEYEVIPNTSISGIVNVIRTVLEKDGRVSAAWLFGSVARGEENINSDVDIMIEMNEERKYSMFDLIDIAYLLEQEVNRKVDLVEKGYLKDFAMKTATDNLIRIYG